MKTRINTFCEGNVREYGNTLPMKYILVSEQELFAIHKMRDFVWRLLTYPVSREVKKLTKAEIYTTIRLYALSLTPIMTGNMEFNYRKVYYFGADMLDNYAHTFLGFNKHQLNRLKEFENN